MYLFRDMFINISKYLHICFVFQKFYNIFVFVKTKPVQPMKKIYFLVVVCLLTGYSLMAQPKAQRLVLIEQFTQASCGYCPAENTALKTLVDANPTKVIDMKYQVSWPGYDPMYLQNTSQVDTRVTYYGVDAVGVPYTVMDGTYLSGGIPATAALNTEYAVVAPFTIGLSHTLSSDYDSVYVTIVVTATQAVTGTLKLQTCLVEKHIHFASAPGSNGETDFYNVMKKMLPTDQGTTLATSWTNGQTQTFTIGAPIPSYLYDISQLAVCAFIQDNATKNVKQAAYSQPISVSLDGSLTAVSNVPTMTCNTTITPTVTLKNTASTTLTSGTIQYKIDAGAPSTTPWTGSLATNATANITLPAIAVTNGSHTFTATLVSPNGLPDWPGNNVVTKAFLVGLTGNAIPVAEGFQSAAFPPAGWIIDNPDAGTTWVRTASAGQGSTASARIDYYSYAAGPIDDLILKPVDLSGVASASLTFYVAHAQYDAAHTDRLMVRVSTNCGSTWATPYNKVDPALSSVTGYVTSTFTPTSTQWRQETVDLSAYVGQPSVFIEFRGTSGYSNMLYIDNINITGVTNVEFLDKEEIGVYPNPSSGIINVMNAKGSTVMVVNVLGEIISTINNASDLESIDLSSFGNGTYVVKVVSDQGILTKKIVLQE
jgi:hypothetical protein